MTTRPTGRQRGRPAYPLLTPAEERVLKLIREGKTNSEIGQTLGVSLDAVKYHVSNMLGKLELASREQLAEWRAPSNNPLGRVWAAMPLLGKVALGASAAVVAGGVAWAAVTQATQPQPLREGLVTLGYDGKPSNGSSSNPQLSADGRYVVFESSASNLVPGDTNNASDVFRYDRRTGQTEMVSEPHLGALALLVGVTSDGSKVAYLRSTGLDNTTSNEIILRDLDHAASTVLAAPGQIGYAALSPDGQYLAFMSLPNAGDAWHQLFTVVAVHTGTPVYTMVRDRQLDPLPGFLPVFSPDSRWLMFSAGMTESDAGCAPEYVDAQIDTERRSVPMSRPIVVELATGIAHCAPLRLADDNGTVVQVGSASISDGVVTYTLVHSESKDPGRVVWFRPETGEVNLLSSSDDLWSAEFSPTGVDGTVAFTPAGRSGVSLLDIHGAVDAHAVDWPKRFERDSYASSQPALSADGRQAAFVIRGQDTSSGSQVADIYALSLR
jgi:DNA-binding CsgD family transcriptional regulator